MKINDAELLISAVRPAQYPETGLKEFVLLGRSNVGKSSFINTLINRKNLARTSNKPGKTQTMNFYQVGNQEDQIVLVDMPGYGYAKVSKKEREKWGQMIETYLQKRDKIARVFLLVDSRVGPTEDDKLMYNWLKYYNIDPIVITTKIDKLSKAKLEESLERITDELELEENDILIPFSSANKSGYDEVWQQIESYL